MFLPMLSIPVCRKLLGKDCELTDAQVEDLRDQLIGFADVSLDAFQTHLAARKGEARAEAQTTSSSEARSDAAPLAQQTRKRHPKIVQVDFGS
jgi:hypothetical protein